MGLIIRFPIIVLDQKATETQYGICPQLCGSISISGGSSSAVVSERGIAVELATLSAELLGQNLGTGLPVFSGASADISTSGIVFGFNSISGMGALNVTSDSNKVLINTIQSGNPNLSGDRAFITQKTLNGGIEQFPFSIYYDSILQTGNQQPSIPSPIITVQEGWVIGKVIMKCTEAFNSSATMYSIGYDNDPEAIVKKFNAPTNITTNTLLNFEYGNQMQDKVEFIETDNISGVISTSGIIDGMNLNLYRWGEPNTAGRIKAIIFYDNNNMTTTI